MTTSYRDCREGDILSSVVWNLLMLLSYHLVYKREEKSQPMANYTKLGGVVSDPHHVVTLTEFSWSVDRSQVE